jgi:hypothetical protein
MFSQFYESLSFSSKDHFCLLLTGTLAASLFGLVAAWTALGRTHRIVKLAVLWLLLGAFVLVPAYDLAMLFLAQVLVVAVPLLLVRRLQVTGLHERTQFGLRDLLFLMLVIAQLAAFAAAMPAKARQHWMEAIGCGTAYGLITLLAVWLAFARRRFWVRLTVGVVVLPLVLLTAWAVPYETVPVAPALFFTMERPHVWALVLMAVVPPGLYLSTTLVCWRAARSERRRQLLRRLGTAGVALLALAIVVPLAVTYYHLVVLTPIPPEEPLPEPNGYCQLMAAAKTLEKVTVPEKSDGSAAMSAFLAQHGTALADARKAMKLPGRVPINYGCGELDLVTASTLRALARGFQAEALAAMNQRRADDAIQSYCDILRIGQFADAGGLLIDWLVARAIQGIGTFGLTDLRWQLSAPQCRRIIAALRESEDTIEPLELASQRDRAWTERAYGWRGRLQLLFEWVRREHSSLNAVMNSEVRIRTLSQLLQAELAVRAYRLEKGRLPQRLESLVPDYLPQLPRDHYSGGPLVYRLNGEGYLLYSVGSDRTDDGGSPEIHDQYGIGSGDLFIEAPK